MENFLIYPQKQLIKKERDINISIQKNIYKSKTITELLCYINPETCLSDICLNKNRIDFFNKNNNILKLPAYLNENAIKTVDLFDEINSFTINNNHESYNIKKQKFIDKSIEHNGWHITSFSLIPNYCNNLEAVNNSIFFAIKNNIIKREDFIKELSKLLKTEDLFEITMANAMIKSTALYNIFKDKDKDKDNKNNILYFFK